VDASENQPKERKIHGSTQSGKTRVLWRLSKVFKNDKFVKKFQRRFPFIADNGEGAEKKCCAGNIFR